MNRFSFSFFLGFLCIFFAIQHACIACETNLHIAYNFLSTNLDTDELALYEERDIAPTLKIPYTIFYMFLHADMCAGRLINQNLKLADIEKLLFEVKKSLSSPADPFLFYSLADALYRQLAPHENSEKKAFMLMARMIMDAPFFASTDNSVKMGFTSFDYFAHCASFYQELHVRHIKDQREVLEFWQIFFFDEAYPSYIMPWLTPLYYFYIQEGSYIINMPDPFSADEWPKLKDKIKSKDRFNDDRWLAKQNILSSASLKSFEYYNKLEEYLIKDINIYWNLLSKLVGKDANLVRDFISTMQEAGADMNTIINSQGSTAFEYFENQVQVPQFSCDAAQCSSLKRKAQSPLQTNCKRACLKNSDLTPVGATR